MSYDMYKGINHNVGIRIIETGMIFETRTQCANYLGVGVSSVSQCLSGKIHTCAGYHLEAIEYTFKHCINNDILDELYELTGEICEWRDHPWRINVYVSDTGIIAKNIRGRIVIRRQHLNNSGYLAVCVGDRNIANESNELVHRLVAETYLHNDDPDHKTCVNHIDGDKFNNCVENLEWCTYSENMHHAVDHRLAKTERVIVVETGEEFPSSAACARAIGGTVSGIHDCKTGRQKQHRGYHFIFPEEDE